METCRLVVLMISLVLLHLQFHLAGSMILVIRKNEHYVGVVLIAGIAVSLVAVRWLPWMLPYFLSFALCVPISRSLTWSGWSSWGRVQLLAFLVWASSHLMFGHIASAQYWLAAYWQYYPIYSGLSVGWMLRQHDWDLRKLIHNDSNSIERKRMNHDDQ